MFDPLEGHDLAAKLLHPLPAGLLRAALHPEGIADLPVGPGAVSDSGVRRADHPGGGPIPDREPVGDASGTRNH